ncbi:unnamed protein product [Lactuca saligna]|uniref:CTP synthase (glutamine hydrolyzing) n=1 Tax=Lactuca saligna TaxID=75948 RepID=A0AA35VZG9_LACSI|nr:unnamed protein product [Lactuca saligna]
MFVNTTKPKTAVPGFACSPIYSSAATLLPYFHAGHRPTNPDVHRAAWNYLKSVIWCDDVVGGWCACSGRGGGGDRGVEGKIIAAKYARENNIPYLSICLGMKIAVIEYARSVLGLENANSTEFDLNTKNPCVIFIPKGSKTHMGGAMRLGSRRTYFQVMDSKAS